MFDMDKEHVAEDMHLVGMVYAWYIGCNVVQAGEYIVDQHVLALVIAAADVDDVVVDSDDDVVERDVVVFVAVVAVVVVVVAVVVVAG